jgi:hypothetical protein
MSKPKGFWSDRDREGQDDARLLATEQLHALRQLPYAELRARADRDTQVEDVTALSGEPYQRRTSVKRLTRGGEEELRITVQVTTGSLLGRLDLLAEQIVVATPDGEMVGDYTMASEGNDPRCL